jgi:hypothetical protein
VSLRTAAVQSKSYLNVNNIETSIVINDFIVQS